MERSFRRLTLPARLESLQAFRQFVRAGAKTAGLPPDDMDKLDLVLEELLVNIARYAYQPASGEAEVAYAVDGGSLLVEISDRGRLFNPLEAHGPDLSLGLADRPIGGLGVLLVKQLAGSLSYRQECGRNTVSFRFPNREESGG